MHRFGGIEGSQLELGENKKKIEIEYWWAGLHVRPDSIWAAQQVNKI
jgi:hypothetical protein